MTTLMSSSTKTFLAFMAITTAGPILIGGSASEAGETLVSPVMAERMGVTEAWRRPLSLPAGAQSIVDQQFFVDRSSMARFVEIVRVSDVDDGKEKKDEAAADDEPPANDESAADDIFGGADPFGESESADGAQESNDGVEESGSGDESGTGGESGSGNRPAKGKNVLTRIRVDQLDRFGNPIGEDEAKRIARNEVRRLKRKGIDAEISMADVASVLLYTLGDDGTMECRDAESGRVRWTGSFGNRKLGYFGFGVDEEYVSVINGANLILVDAKNGEVLHTKQTFHPPGRGSVHVGDFAFIPTIGGGLEGHHLSDPRHDPYLQQVSGAVIQVPTLGPGTLNLAFPTESEFVYVMEMEGEPSDLFRLNTDGRVRARIAAIGDAFYFATDLGQAYAVRATRTGDMLWTRSFGEPFLDPPSIHRGRMLLRSAYGNLYSLNLKDGTKNWSGPVAGVDQLLAMFDEQIFVRTLTGRLAVVDLESGDYVTEFSEVKPTNFLINRVSDRLYLISDSGTVQCLRPRDRELPTLKETQTAPRREAEKAETPSEDRERVEEPSEATDPFDTDGGRDPFDPGSGDPFGGDASMDDPFGGADDPFGGF